MESLNKILFLCLVSKVILCVPLCLADSNSLGIVYFNKFMGHIHKSALSSSESVTSIQCAQPLKVLPKPKGVEVNDDWLYVSAGEDKGYLKEEFVSLKRKECFQDKYPRFYQKLNLELTDLYYFGRLHDRYIEGHSKVSK